MRDTSRFHYVLGLILITTVSPCFPASQNFPNQQSIYLDAVKEFADNVLKYGRDTYGPKQTPLFVDGMHTVSLKPVVWKKDGQSWVLSNFASQQPLIRLLDGLSVLTNDPKYRRAAMEATRYALKNLQSPSGLLYWGGHVAWDLEEERTVGQYAGIHEMKVLPEFYAR